MMLLGGLAWGASPIEEAQQVELERVRVEVADEIQLAAYDLIDELVYGWSKDPVFDETTPVVLAGVSVPVGLGTGMQALLENHLSAVLRDNPSSQIQLVHCPVCTAVVVQSGPEATVVSRGIDNPETLARLGGATGRHALFVDIEAEGSWLVLRARLTQLSEDLPIVWSHTLASPGSSPALLRESRSLKSAAEARQEYLNALRDRGPIRIPVRFAVRTYASPFDGQGLPPPPFIWLQSGVELGATQARAWTASLLVGYSFIPQAYQGLMGQARVSRLVSGRVRSHTRPDLYLFLGGAVMTVWGPATAGFQDEVLNVDQIIQGLNGEGPRTSFGTFQVGADLRVGNRVGLSTFLEVMPSLRSSPNMGTYVRVLGVGYQSLGTEVTFWF